MVNFIDVPSCVASPSPILAIASYITSWLVVLSHPSEKWWSLSVGMSTNPIYGNIKNTGWWFEPLWKIWKSIGMIIPNIWENKKWMSSSQLTFIFFRGVAQPPTRISVWFPSGWKKLGLIPQKFTGGDHPNERAIPSTRSGCSLKNRIYWAAPRCSHLQQWNDAVNHQDVFFCKPVGREFHIEHAK